MGILKVLVIVKELILAFNEVRKVLQKKPKEKIRPALKQGIKKMEK